MKTTTKSLAWISAIYGTYIYAYATAVNYEGNRRHHHHHHQLIHSAPTIVT